MNFDFAEMGPNRVLESQIKKRGEDEIDLAARAGWRLVGCCECERGREDNE